MFSNNFNNSPALENLMRYVYTLGAWTAVTRLYYQGTSAGSEFETYAANKLYVAMEFESTEAGAVTVGANYMVFYNAANVACLNATNASGWWNATTAAMNLINNNLAMQNFYFSRFATVLAKLIKFNGFRLTL